MTCRVRAGLAALGLLGFAAGCGEAQEPRVPPPATPNPTSAALETLGRPGPQDRPFGEALSIYADGVGGLHAFEDRRADPAIDRAVQDLADALERMPVDAGEPSLRHAAEGMRAGEPAGMEPPAVIERSKRALEIAATALLRIAAVHYRAIPSVHGWARSFAASASAIDPTREPPDRAGVIDALVRAERVLAAMYAVNVAPSPPPVDSAR